MAVKMFRYLKLFRLLVKVNYMKAMEYRIDFFFSILPTGVYSLSYIIFLGTILSKIPVITGWNFDQMLVLFATEQIFYYSGWILYRRSIDSFPRLIRDGTLDMTLKTPINSRFLISFRDQSPDVIVPFLTALAVLVYAVRNFSISVLNLISFFLFIISGIVILYNLLFIFASLAFWTTEADEFVQFVDEVLSFGRYPLQIFPSFIGLLLLTVIPAILMVYVPATALLGILDLKIALLSVIMVLTTFFISQVVWKSGLRHYSSASS